MPPILIRILADAAGRPCPVAGRYIRDFDPDAFNGRGELKTTTDPKQAKAFPSIDAAAEYWRQQSRSEPTRADGRPNRPLTAYHCDIGPLET